MRFEALSATYHLPQFVRTRKLLASTLHYLYSLLIANVVADRIDVTYKRLLVKRPILAFVVDIGQPWLYAAGISQQILLIDSVLIRLDIDQSGTSYSGYSSNREK